MHDILIWAPLVILALALLLANYSTFQWFLADGERLGWQFRIRRGRHPVEPELYVTWEKYPVVRLRRLDLRREKAQPYLGYQPAWVLRWRAFRVVFLGRLK